ncbi:MAG: hypothetical protein FJ271_15145 [Planctomycetes bacterium]|nr:hypothetical protein [Planctomycetota bacterium]
MTLNQIVERFKEKAELLRKSDEAAVLVVIDQGRLMVQLRTKARKNWEKTCEEKLQINKRVARRYVKIGEKWSSPDRTPGSDMVGKLPSDLHKLEVLCDLSLEQLKTLADQSDLRKRERTEVIATVKALLGKTAEDQSAPNPVLTVLNRWDGFVAKLVKDVKKLDDAGRKEFAEELDDLLQQLREELDGAFKAPPSEDSAEQSEGEPEDETDADMDDDDEEEDPEASEEETPEEEDKEPAPKSPATKGSRSPVKQRPKS